MTDLTPETVALFRDMVQRKGDFLRYLQEHGNKWEQAVASVVLEAGT